MAKRKKKRGRPRKYKHDRDPLLSAETKHGIFTVVLWALGIVSLLALFNLAGPLGGFWQLGLTRLFGWGDFLIPIILILLGYTLLRPGKYDVKSMNYWGIILGVLSFYSLLHWTQGQDKLISAISTGRGGGLAGLILSWPLFKIFGSVAGLIILIALLVVSLLLVFNTSIERLIGDQNIFRRVYLSIRHFFMHRKYNSSNDYNDETEDEVEPEEEIYDEAKEPEPEPESEDIPDIELDANSEFNQKVLFTQRRRMPKIELPLDLLSGKTSKPNSGDIRANQQIIKNTLENFGIEVEMGEVSVGPTVTQYTLRPTEGVKLTQITTLQNDLALALSAHPIRLEAPIPNKALVGIEVPNQTVAIVTLREVLDSPTFKKERPSHLTLPLGKDVAGIPFLADLDKMPHLLIAGATGSGKSISVNSMIISLMAQNQPDELKFILVDPKRVELTTYADIPYLLAPVIVDVKKTINSLRWAVSEMDRRFNLLSDSGFRNITSFNKSAGSGERLPYIVIIIDELADLMSVAAAEVEGAIVRLAQMARAVGIHLIVATQRPSVDVITGLIKANITARIAFSVASLVDSRTILDNAGAEKLLGRGDMLFISAELSKPKRLQGAFVSDKDIDAVVAYLKSRAKPDYIKEVSQQATSSTGAEINMDESDDLLDEAIEIITRADKASASLLQRRLRVGYARAARILDILEERGIIGPADGSKPREVLMSKDESEYNEYKEGN